MGRSADHEPWPDDMIGLIGEEECTTCLDASCAWCQEEKRMRELPRLGGMTDDPES